jgi:hypothetical protein
MIEIAFDFVLLFVVLFGGLWLLSKLVSGGTKSSM